MTTWQEELIRLIDRGCTDSDIEDFCDSHPEADNAWNFVADYTAPAQCKGCKNVQMLGQYPCTRCLRSERREDLYELREGAEPPKEILKELADILDLFYANKYMTEKLKKTEARKKKS